MIIPEFSNVTPEEALELQERLRHDVRLVDDLPSLRTVAGVDVAVPPDRKAGKCAIAVLSFPALDLLELRTHEACVTFAYIPGLLAFRELPIFFQTYELLDTKPDLILFDGQGYAHPRRFGLACHAGLLLDIPTIGCAKSRLIGDYSEPSLDAGSTSPLIAPEGDRIGDVVRTRTGSKPIFVSPGHRIAFETARSIVLLCAQQPNPRAD